MTKKTLADRDRTRREPIPVYYQLQQALLRDIENGVFAPGESIPPERVIAQAQGVSLGTVKRAMLNLVSEGYLYRVQGKGTFVAGTTLRRGSLRYYRLFGRLKDEEADLKVKLLDIAVIPGFEPISGFLSARLNQKLYRVRRLFLMDETPVVYNDSYLPQGLLPGLDKKLAGSLEKITLYHAIEECYGLPTVKNEELFGAVAAQGEAAELLQVRPGQPLLRVEMLAITYKERPYEYRLAYVRTDERFVYREI